MDAAARCLRQRLRSELTHINRPLAVIATAGGISLETKNTMAKIVNIQLLVNANDEAQIADGLNDALRSIVHPMGSGYAQDSFILDYKLANLDAAVPATTEVEQDIANGSYEESAAFQEISDNTHAVHHYLLHIEEDVEPNLIGPFDNEAALLAKAIEVNKHSPDDGLFRVTADKASKIEVDAFTGDDLIGHPAAVAICAAFLRGEAPLERLATSRYFTYSHEGDEVLVDASLIDALEQYTGDDLVIDQGEVNEIMIPARAARARVSKEQWEQSVADGSTELGFTEWREMIVQELPRARAALNKNGTQR